MKLDRLKKFSTNIWSRILSLIRPNRKDANNKTQVIADYDKRLVMSLSSTRFPKIRQIKYIPQFFNKNEKKQLKLLSLVAIVSLLLFGTSFFYNNSQDVPKAGGTYTEATVGTPQYLNPILAASDTDLDLTKLIFSGLLGYNSNLELESDLAEKYEISEDQTKYTFTLKKNLKWHDDKDLTASDVAYTFNTIQNPRYASPLEPSFRGVKIKQLDDYTIEFTLDKPFAPFLDNLTVGIIPKHLWQNIPAQNFKLAELNIKPIGSGQWQFDSLKKDKDGNLISYTLKPFTEYQKSIPYLDNITFKFYPDIDSAITAITEQNSDGISFLPKDKKDLLTGKKNVVINNLQLPQYTAIFINQNKNEFLQDLKVRKALALSTSKQKIIFDVFAGEAEIVNGPLLPGIPGYDSNINPYPYNVEEAKKILDEAGYQFIEGNDYRQKDEKTLEVTLTTVNLEDNLKTTNVIKENWEEIGVKTNISIVTSNVVQTQVIKPRNYELLIFGEILGADPDFYPFWHSSQIVDPGLNLTDFSNKKVDALLEQARQTSNLTQRAQMYSDFQKIINEQVPAIFLFQPTYSYVLPPKIKGFTINRINLASDRFNDITNWYVKTKRRLILD